MTQTTTRHNWRKGLALLLALVMCLGFLPAGVFTVPAKAAGTPPTADWIDTWLSYDEKSDGTIIINSFDSKPANHPTEVVIPKQINGKNVTEIKAEAFIGAGLTKLEFEDGCVITTIGAQAFRANGSLTEVIFPASMCETLTSIGDRCFIDCVNLKTVNVGDLKNLTTIKEYTFRNTKLSDYSLPPNLTKIERGAISVSGGRTATLKIPKTLTSYPNLNYNYLISSDLPFNGIPTLDLSEFEAGNLPAYFSWPFANNVIYSDKNLDLTTNTCFVFNTESHLICGLKNDANRRTDPYPDYSTDLVIPTHINGVEVWGIADGAFVSNYVGRALSSVTFAEDSKVTEIPRLAFGWNSLTKITLPDGITAFGQSAFSNCANLAGTDGNGTFYLPKALKSIGRSAFNGDPKLKKVVASTADDGKNLTTIDSATFNNCENLMEIDLSAYEKDSIKNARWGATKATVKWANNEVTESPFKSGTDSNGKQWLFAPGDGTGGTVIKYLGGEVELEELTIPNKLTYDGTEYTIQYVNGRGAGDMTQNNIFPGGTQVKKVIVSDGILGIQHHALQGSGIEEIDLGNTLDYLFGALYDNELTSLTLPESITYLAGGTSFLRGNGNIEKLVIPRNVTRMDIQLPATIKQVEIMQYEDSDTDAFFNRATAQVRANAAEWGIPVIWQDTPKPRAEYVAVSNALSAAKADALVPEAIKALNNPSLMPKHDPTDNTVNIYVEGYTNDAFYIVRDITTAQNATPSGIDFVSATEGGATTTSAGNITQVMAPNQGRTKPTISGPVVATADGTYNFKLHIVRTGFRNTNEPENYKHFDDSFTLDAFHTVTFDRGAGQGTAPAAMGPYVEGYKLTLPQKNADMEYSGHVFIGWLHTDDNGTTTPYKAGDSFLMPDGDATLVANWPEASATSVTVIFDANASDTNWSGGTYETIGNPEAMIADVLTVNGNSVAPERPGYRQDHHNLRFW